MLMIEDREKVEAAVERLKLAHVSHNPSYWVPILFPEIVTGNTREPQQIEVEVEPDDILLDDTAGDWKFTDNVSPEDAEAILRQLVAQPTGRINGADMDEGWLE